MGVGRNVGWDLCWMEKVCVKHTCTCTQTKRSTKGGCNTNKCENMKNLRRIKRRQNEKKKKKRDLRKEI